jgi:chromosome partitioning protein
MTSSHIKIKVINMSIILAVLANAGGVGKTTLCAQLAYLVASQGYKVALFDLDPQRSLDVFCGFEGAQEQNSVLEVISNQHFQGEYPLVNAWGLKGLDVCQGHPLLSDAADELVPRRRGCYVLADAFGKYPLPHDLVILDCPATLGKLTENAIAACTHYLIPIQLETKAVNGASDLVSWVTRASKELRLNPWPKLLGLVPSMYDKDHAMHRQYLAELPDISQSLGTKLFQAIRYSREFPNASAYGKPLSKYRPGHPAIADFRGLTESLVELLHKEEMYATA